MQWFVNILRVFDKQLCTLIVLSSFYPRCLPLRIKHDSYQTYGTIHRNGQRNKNDTDRVNMETLPYVQHLYTTCMALYRLMESATTKNRITFRQTATNTRYYHSRPAVEVGKLDQAGIRLQVDRKDHGQILKELEDLELRMPDWEYQNTSRNTLHWAENKWDYAASPLFMQFFSAVSDVVRSAHSQLGGHANGLEKV